MSNKEVEVIERNFCVLGESPHWSDAEQCLYYIDYLGKKIWRYDPKSGENKSLQLEGPEFVSVVIPIEGTADQFIITRERKVCKLTWNGNADNEHNIETLLSISDEEPKSFLNDGKCDSRGRLWIGSVEKTLLSISDEEPKSFLNDGKCDSRGRLWIGSVEKVQNTGTLYRIGAASGDGKHSIEEIFSGLAISNGLGWSPDDKYFYHIDSLTWSISVFDFDVETGDVSNKRRLISFEKVHDLSFPDGMAVDEKGHLWMAFFGKAQVLEIDPGTNDEDAGKIVSTINFGANSIASLAFGGKDLSDLYVTSGTFLDESGSADAGSLFRIKGTAKGLPAKSFTFSK